MASRAYHLSQEYNISTALGNKGSTTWDNSSNSVKLTLTGNLGLNTHEFKYAYLFESGTLSLATGPAKSSYLLLDIDDDVAAYKGQRLFDPESLPSQLVKGISAQTVRLIEDNCVFLYQNYPERRTDLPVLDRACTR